MVPADFLVRRGLRNGRLGGVLLALEHGSRPRWYHLPPECHQTEVGLRLWAGVCMRVLWAL